MESWTEREGVLASPGDLRKTVSYGYDLAGNRTSRTELDAGGAPARQTGYTWDFNNRLVTAGDGGNAAPYSNGESVHYKWSYDYRTRRVESQRQPVGQSPEKLRFIFSGGQSVREEAVGQGDSGVVEYVRASDWGGGIGGILTVVQNWTRYYNHYNNRGDLVLQTNGDYRTESYQAQYEAFGTRTVESGTKRGRQGANTKDEELDLALLNEGFRYRDLETGTFLSRDPAGFVDGPNLYAYVLQNPWSKFDPEGLFWKPADLLEKGADMFENIATSGKVTNPTAVFGASIVSDGLRFARSAGTLTGLKEGYDSLVDSTSSVMENNMTAGNGGWDEAGSAITGVFYTGGQIFGYTPALEAVMGVDFATEDGLGTGERWTRGVRGGAQMFLSGVAVAKGYTPKSQSPRSKSFSVEKAHSRNSSIAGVTELDGNVTVYKDGVRAYAKGAGTSVRHELRTTVFHEKWHQGSLLLRRQITKCLPTGLRAKAWNIMQSIDEPLAEAYGQSRAILRDFKRPTGDPSSRKYHKHE